MFRSSTLCAQQSSDFRHVQSIAALSPQTNQSASISVSPSHTVPTEASTLLRLSPYVKVNPSLTFFDQSSLRLAISNSLDLAIREIISPVVERSVTIACITTREVILKDFAMEPSEVKMQNAAHKMVSSLAGSLALVTCKEPLRASMGIHLRALLPNSSLDPSLVDQAIQSICSDNLELGSRVIEKAAIEKAIKDIDESLSRSFIIRRSHREQTGEAFYDLTIFASGNRYPKALSDVLRPEPVGLTPKQLMVYEAFSRPSFTSRLNTSANDNANINVNANINANANANINVNASTAATVNLNINPGISSNTVNRLGNVNSSTGSAVSSFPEKVFFDKLEDVYHKIAAIIQDLIRVDSGDSPIAMLPKDHELICLIRSIHAQFTSINPTQSAPLIEPVRRFTEIVYNHLFDNPFELWVEAHVMILQSTKAFPVVSQTVFKLFSQRLFEDSVQGFSGIVLKLIQANILTPQEVDAAMTQAFMTKRSRVVLDFVHKMINQSGKVGMKQYFPQTLDAIEQISRTDTSAHLDSTIANKNSMPGSMSTAKSFVAFDKPEIVCRAVETNASLLNGPSRSGLSPINLTENLSRDEFVGLVDEWIDIFLSMYSTNPQTKDRLPNYFNRLGEVGVLDSEDALEKFLTVFAEIAVESCYMKLDTEPQVLRFGVIMAFSRLVVVLIENICTKDVAKTNLLARVLLIITQITIQSHTTSVLANQTSQNSAPFDQRPYFRLFLDLLIDVSRSDPVIESNRFHVWYAFSVAFFSTRPTVLPAFTFSWLELISHRYFMPKLLIAKYEQAWQNFHTLLLDLFTFIAPHLRTGNLTPATKKLYLGTLRLLLVLLHDFPEFLCEYHFSLCDKLPSTCIQMRNLILSAFPQNMKLPDPFMPNLKVDLLPDITQPPIIRSDFTLALKQFDLFSKLDSYLKTRTPSNFLLELPTLLLSNNSSDNSGSSMGSLDISYNVPLINSLVAYIGSTAPAFTRLPSDTPKNPSTEILRHLAVELSPEGRYYLFSAVANHLRYPNSHTHYFSCAFLFLFGDINDEFVREQITRVLLERLILYRPHPWGLLITFIELIKNPQYSFWKHRFIRCSPDIEKLFESVSKSCMGAENGLNRL